MRLRDYNTRAGGATPDVGAPENRITVPKEHVLTPRGSDIYPATWTRGHRPPPKKYSIVTKFVNSWMKTEDTSATKRWRSAALSERLSRDRLFDVKSCPHACQKPIILWTFLSPLLIFHVKKVEPSLFVLFLFCTSN